MCVLTHNELCDSTHRSGSLKNNIPNDLKPERSSLNENDTKSKDSVIKKTTFRMLLSLNVVRLKRMRLSLRQCYEKQHSECS